VGKKATVKWRGGDGVIQSDLPEGGERIQGVETTHGGRAHFGGKKVTTAASRRVATGRLIKTWALKAIPVDPGGALTPSGDWFLSSLTSSLRDKNKVSILKKEKSRNNSINWGWFEIPQQNLLLKNSGKARGVLNLKRSRLTAGGGGL